MNNQLTKGGGSRELSTDINVITAEINVYQQVAGEAIFEIGRRLKHVKENDLAHGEFTEWIEKDIGINYRQANRFMKVAEELGELNMTTSSLLGLNVLYEIATLPTEEREVLHKLPTGETKRPEDMTVRELRELKRQLKAEQAERERLEKENSDLANREPEVVVKTEYVEVDNTPEDVKELVKERDELDAALSQTYARLRDLEQLEKSVKHQRQSPLYDMHRSLKSALSYVQVFTDNDRQSRNIIANSDKDIAEEIQFTIKILIEELEFANDIFMDELQKDIVDADFNEID